MHFRCDTNWKEDFSSHMYGNKCIKDFESVCWNLKSLEKVEVANLFFFSIGKRLYSIKAGRHRNFVIVGNLCQCSSDNK